MRPEKYKANISQGLHILMMILSKNEPLTMSDIGKRLVIPKPNVTSLVERLLVLKLAEKLHDKKDRRKVFVSLTQKGIKLVNELKTSTRQNIKQKILSLSDNDLDLLAGSLQTVRNIFLKIPTEPL